MNTKNFRIAPMFGEQMETAHSVVNNEVINTEDEIRLALKLLKIVTEEPISYAKAEIALDYAKQFLDNMIISGSEVIPKLEELLR